MISYKIKHCLMNNSFFFLFIALINLAKSQVLDFASETNWPAQCQGQRQTPVDFPAPSQSNGTYQPLNNTKILFNNYNTVSGISMFQSIPNGKFAFNQSNMGDLFFQKNGYFYKYNLAEIHFHAPSEHTINGTQYDLEMHLVHFKDKTFFSSANLNTNVDPDSQQQILVVGILFSKSDFKNNLNSNPNNTFISALKLWNTSAIVDNFNLNDFSRSDKYYLHYEGSLTTPGCNETVNWVVMTQIESISTLQLSDFLNLMKRNGYTTTGRKTKPLNGRKIFYNDVSTFSPVSFKSNGFFLKVQFISIFLVFSLLILL